MAAVRELVTKLSFRVDSAKLRSFDQKIGSIKNNVRGLTQNMRGLASSVQRVGAGLSAFVTLPLTALGFVALKTTADLEKAKIALEVFLGSEEAALAKQKELIEFAKETPFQVLGIQETAGQLLAAGIESDRLITTMNALGNAAKGNQEVFQRLVLNFSQVKTQGKLTGRELRDFLVNQVPLVKLLAKEIGTSESAIKDLVSKGAISFDVMEKAFFNASKEGGFFFDLMKKQSKTLSGRFSNLQDTVTQLLDEFGKAIDETFNLRENINKLITFIDKLRNRFTNLNPNVKKLIIVFATMLALLGPLLLVLGTIATAILALTAAAFVLDVALLPLIITIGLIIAAIAAIGFAIFLVINDFNTWRDNGDSVIGFLIGKFMQFKAFVGDILRSIGAFFVNAWNFVINATDEQWDDLIDRIIEKGLTLLTRLKETFIKIKDGIVAIFVELKNDVIEIFTSIIPEAFSKTLGKLKSLKDRITGKVGAGLDIAKKLGGGLARGGAAIAKQATDIGILPNIPLLASAAGGLGRSSTSNSNQTSISQDIKIEVPPGTSEQQAQFIEDSAKESFGKMFNNEMTKNLMATPQAEQ